MRTKITLTVILSLVLLSSCGEKPAPSKLVSETSVTESSQSFEDSKPTVDEPSNVQVEESSVTPSSIEENEESEFDPLNLPGLAGSHYIDVALNLEKRGFSDHEGGASTGYCSGNKEIYEGGTCSYYLAINRSYEIISGSFCFTDMTGLPQEDCFKIAQSYLEFCSTFPYDGNNTDEAQKFVSENITNDGAETQIGDAKFSIEITELNNGTDITLAVVYAPQE